MDFVALQAFCRGLPGTTEDIKWENHLTFLVGEKMYAILALDQQPPHLCFKTTPEQFAQLTQQDGVIPAPYLARYAWVTLTRLDALPETLLISLLRESYQMVLKKLPKSVRLALAEDTA